MATLRHDTTPVWHTDPGHAWLEVPLADIADLPISNYSFRQGDRAYLEEDCDAYHWLKAHGYITPDGHYDGPDIPSVRHAEWNRAMKRV